MNAVDLHLSINFIPNIAMAVGICLLLFSILKKNQKLTNLIYLIYILIALLAIPILLSGQASAGLVKNEENINLDALTAHAQIAKVTFWYLESLGLLSAVALFINLKTKKYNRRLSISTLILTAIAFTLTIITGTRGGEIEQHETKQKSNVFQNPSKMYNQDSTNQTK